MYHKIHLLKMHNLMTFKYMHGVQSFYSRTFSWLPKETLYLLVVTAKPLLPQTLKIANLFSASKNLSILDISNKWNHAPLPTKKGNM